MNTGNMSDLFSKLKELLKPLFGALILVIFVWLFSLGGKEDLSPETLSANLANSQNIFVGLSQTPQPELPNFILEQGNTFRAASPFFTIAPKVLGAFFEGFDFEDTKRTITEYAVEQGDSPWSISVKFEVSLPSILWANDLTETTIIKPGQTLIIPPVTGTIHHVSSGDTVGSIAEKYKGETEEIISFNQLSGEADIFIGDILVVPDGVMPAPAKRASANWIPIGNSYFICPISSPCRITQGLHWYNAIDFSHGKCGETIYAAAGGTILKVKLTNSTSRWAFGGAGNHLTILHPNGAVTMYGHISMSFVSPGESVYQGQAIALTGGQPGTPGAGTSTGCHLHFGVSGARNPFQ